MFFSCSKTGNGTLIKGKLVYSSCATAVIQIMEPAHFDLGQATWQQSPQLPVYTNVFAVDNLCSYRAGNTINVGDQFYFRVTNAGDTDCAVCMLWDNPPMKKQKVYVP